MRKVRLLSCIFFSVLFHAGLYAQHADSTHRYTYADTLHGSLRPERTCYDALHYDLVVKVNMDNHGIGGYSDMLFKVLSDCKRMQLDLFANFHIDSILIDHIPCTYKRDGNAIFINTPAALAIGSMHHLKCSYHGIPRVAVKPPWDGGFVWQKDFNGKPWLGVACQLNGASIWWPCKDHPSDEPDNGVDLFYDVPSDLKAIANGNLIDVNHYNETRTIYHWRVTAPINLYDVTLNVADYAHIKDFYLNTQNDTLHLDYYVLKGNEYKAKEHFQQVKTMMACYEKRFGPYPFYHDGYKLCESSYWGMEHQSCVAYGNLYKNMPGFDFDFIIIHESAHEWWGNNLSAADNADDWLHESFATYAEALYVECMQGHDKYIEYLKKQKWMIKNEHPVIGDYGVYFNASDNDLYYKGTWMLHTFRNVLNNDTFFFGLLHHLQSQFGYKTTNTDAVVNYICLYTHTNYTPLFNEYLRHKDLPVLHYHLQAKGHNLEVKYRWQADEKDFAMPIEISTGKQQQTREGQSSFNKAAIIYTTITPTAEWQTIVLKKMKKKYFSINENNFLIKSQQDK